MASLTTFVQVPSLNRLCIPSAAGAQSAVSSRSTVQFSSIKASNGGLHETRRSALKWTNSGVFANVTNKLLASTSAHALAIHSRSKSLKVSAFTPEQSKLVKDSWKMLQNDDAGEHALKFFLKVFEIAPTVKRLFSFLRDSPYPIEKNPHLKSHALTVFVTTGQAASQLGQKGALDAMLPRLRELGQSHVVYKVVDEHFDVVKFALLSTLAEALPEVWNSQLKEAWSVAYDEVVDNIKAEMHAVQERQAQRPLVGAGN